MQTIQLLRHVAFVLATTFFTSAAFAQATPATPATPAAPAQAAKPSPAATAKGKIGSADVTINYSSPAVKGRTIYGGLVPYNQVWRAGANEATTVEFSKPVKVEGKPLDAGKYSFFAIPTEKQWTVIFNRVPEQWGAFKYAQKDDALRVTVTPRKAATMAERLVYEVNSTGLVLRWENLEVPIAIK